MANFTGLAGSTELTSTSRTTVQSASHALGSRFYDKDGNEYVYVKAGATIAAKDAVRFAGSVLGYDDIRPTSADNQQVLGAATAAFASAEFGCVLTRGICDVKVIVATAAGSALNSGGTAGTLKLAVAADVSNVRAVALVTGVAAGSGVAFQ